MPAVLFLVTLGGLMVYSAIEGVSMVDALKGVKGAALNPRGGYVPGSSGASGGPGGSATAGITNPGGLLGGLPAGNDGGWTAPAGGASNFQGPRANLLNQLASTAQHQFGLTITATTNGVHVTDSYHYRGRAFDASGAEINMHNFAQYVEQGFTPEIAELIHNPGFAVKDGRIVSPTVYAAVWAGHRNHVHVAA